MTFIRYLATDDAENNITSGNSMRRLSSGVVCFVRIVFVQVTDRFKRISIVPGFEYGFT